MSGRRPASHALSVGLLASCRLRAQQLRALIETMLLAACEQVGPATVLSLDQRLRTYRPTFANSLELLP